MFFMNKIALVTGGTSGIGKEIVKQLLEEGATVIANYCQNNDRMEETKQELNDDNLSFFKCDVSKESQVIDLFKYIKEKHGKLDFLINNAGINIDSNIEYFNLEEFERVIDVNLIGKFLCTKHSIDLLKESLCPSIVNIASRLGTKPCEGASAYCTAEAGIINFSQASALELSKYKIRVNTVSPSLTITPLSLNGWTTEEIKEQTESNPLKRLGETTDMANAVLFLLSDKASYINGENINVNGGCLL